LVGAEWVDVCQTALAEHTPVSTPNLSQ
jgi:hypothetical protein